MVAYSQSSEFTIKNPYLANPTKQHIVKCMQNFKLLVTTCTRTYV